MNYLYPALTLLLILSGIASAENKRTDDIPSAGRVRIDGKLDDWRKAEWTPLTQTLHGTPAISNAEWSIQWDDEPCLYIAVRYNDPDPVLKPSFSGIYTQDCISIFVRGDNRIPPTDYSIRQDTAQHYLFGLSDSQTNAWKKLANIEPFPTYNPAEIAITRSGTLFVYEIKVPVYDRFDATSRRDCSKTEMAEGTELGVDIIITDVSSIGYAGMLGENQLPDKPHNAASIALRTLGE